MAKTTAEIPLKTRQALCDAKVTLDGLPARISGYNQRFARVTALPHGRSDEWSWETVARIVARDGKFHS